MKRSRLHPFLFLIFVFLFTSCEVIVGIFKVGFLFGVIVVLAIIGLIFFVITRFL